MHINRIGKPVLWWMLLAAALAFTTQARANDTQYYFDNRTGCTNDASGGTQAQPWCDISRVSSMTFGPGDVINLARGATWVNQTMAFDENDNGSDAKKVTIQAYGTGNRPHITSDKITAAELRPLRGIVLRNASNWVIKDLEVSYVGAGIHFLYTTIDHQNIQLNNLNVHHVYGFVKGELGPQNPDGIYFSSGILFNGPTLTSLPVGHSVIKNLIIDGIEGSHNQDSISIQFPTTVSKDAAKFVWLNHLNLHDDDADVGTNSSNSNSCSDSLRLVRVAALWLTNSVLEREAGCYSETGTAAVLLGFSARPQIINNIIRDTPVTLGYNSLQVWGESPDQSAIDLEVDNDDVRIHGNVFTGTKMGVECMVNKTYTQNQVTLGFPCNLHVSNNAFSSRRGNMFINGQSTYASGDFKSNVYYANPGSFLKYKGNNSEVFTKDYDAYKNIVSIDNTSIPALYDVYAAANDFGAQGSRQWFYYYRSSNWTQMTFFDTATKRWYPSASDKSVFVSQFELQPNQNKLVARAWQAPKDGTIIIRGQVAKAAIGPDAFGNINVDGSNSTGDGVAVRIVKYSSGVFTNLWPLADGSTNLIGKADLLGIAAQTAAPITVKAGDIIGFEVGSAGNDIADTTSWAPIIAYTDGPANVTWQFKTPNWMEYWGKWQNPADYANLMPSLKDILLYPEGVLSLDITGTGSWIQSRLSYEETNPEDLAIDGNAYNYATIKLKHDVAAGVTARLSWIYEGQTWPVAAAQKVTLAFPTAGSYGVASVFLGDNTSWKGHRIKQLRLEPIGTTTVPANTHYHVDVDYIRLDGANPAP